MPTLTQAIESRARAFALDITALVQATLLEAIAVPAPLAAQERPAARRSPKPKLAAGEKRSPKELLELGARFCGYVTRTPGLGIETIARALSVETRELVLPIKKLIADGAVTTQGEKRARKYFPRAVG